MFRHFHFFILILVVALFGLIGGISEASIPSPRLKPLAPNLSQTLSDNDSRYFRAGLRSAERKNWSQVSSAASRLQNPTAKDVLTWVRASNDPNTPMDQLTYMSDVRGDWPRMVSIRAKAEAKLFDRPMSAQRTIAWFNGREPVSGEGRAALAHAYFQLGDTLSGDKWLKMAWRESKLTRDRQRTLFGRYKSRLSAEDHAARADHLIWEGSSHFSKAQALLPHMNSAQRNLMDARMRVAGNRSGMDRAINSVPRNLQSDPGLLYERARWRRRKKTKSYALPVHLDLTRPPVSERGKSKVWTEKKIMAYWALEEGRHADAYNLTLNHGTTRGTIFAEAEFLAGWLSLTKMRNPQQAKPHFERLANGVTYPVSISRAQYWLGRTHEALGTGQATIHYAQAARFSNTFYGFLAGEKLGGGNLLVTLPYEQDPVHLKAQFESDDRIRAMRLLGEAQSERYFNQFAFHLDDEVETQAHLTLLSNLAREYGYMKPAVRAAKQASRFQSMQTESGYPMPDVIMQLPSKFDIPFVLSIARQESEFNTRAVSHARAYGIMQMINSTARSTARRHRLPYNRQLLTTDPAYSANLGALHLHDLLRDYDGSYIMAAAAYNAGGHRVKTWVRDFGDPRTGEIDPVDWMESIPFTETRNYVQRVMENMQVYRARMNGNTAQNRVYRDITSGAF